MRLTNVDDFFAYARERYIIHLRRLAGRPKPWTADPVLQQYRFCNIFREDDTVTQWIRQRLTSVGYGPRLLGALVIARWFNRIETLERLLPPAGCEWPYYRSNLLYNWDQQEAWRIAMRERLEGISPLVTGAYMIKTPAGKNKLEGLLWCLGEILPDAIHLANHIEPGETTLEGVHGVLKEYPYLGAFMAYEIVTDLRHSLLSEAPDIMTWASAGPGAARGLARVTGQPLGTWRYSFPKHQQELIAGMRCLLQSSQEEKHWPAEWPRWEMREVEHTLCEFDKYMRACNGEGQPKQRYKGT